MTTTIILTTTVTVQDKVYLFQTDKQERAQVYIKKIKQWLYESKFRIVVVENTGYTFEELNEEKEIFKNRFQVISYVESELEEADFLKGNPYKGASEIFSIDYAYKTSWLCKNADFIIKITGRFFIPHLEEYLKQFDVNQYDVLTQNKTHRCEMLGCHKNHFSTIFDTLLINENGEYNGNVEDIYQYRCSIYENKIHCPEFNIEGTQRGGINEVFYNI
jgi:KaiC/GvpD/RAD55 family RecA-like ATPase